jgi:hypothetical protein
MATRAAAPMLDGGIIEQLGRELQAAVAGLKVARCRAERARYRESAAAARLEAASEKFRQYVETEADMARAGSASGHL